MTAQVTHYNSRDLTHDTIEHLLLNTPYEFKISSR